MTSFFYFHHNDKYMRILCLRIKNYSFNITRYKVTKIWKYSFIKLEFMDISHLYAEIDWGV